MATYPILVRSIPAAVLGAALALCEIHGPYYARCFLEEHGVDSSVITELLDGDDGPTTAPQSKFPTEPWEAGSPGS